MEPFIAQIMQFGGNFAPRGWALCNGQLMSISSNPALFSVLGTHYGGNGRTTFALPDLRGRAPIHAGTGVGLSPREIGQQIGVEAVALNEAQMPAHSHDLNVMNMPNDNAWPTDKFSASADIYSATPTPLTQMNNGNIGRAGGGQQHENMQPSLVISYIIALQGVFPSRN